jgi:NAD(P)-dependent dehydrogenase (short-subunit alcohol dehydrogenase family)
MERNSLEGKVIAVTGGSSGIGLGIVKKLIALNAKVAVADVSPAPAELKDVPNLIFSTVDVSSREQVHTWIEQIVKEFGRLDGLCANAGICPYEGGIVSDEHYARVFAVCVTGVWNCGTEAYWQFEAQGGGGAIVNTSSGAGLRAVKGLAVYSAAKHAVIGLTKAWALDWADKGIRVNSLAPGDFLPHLFPFPGGGSGSARCPCWRSRG